MHQLLERLYNRSSSRGLLCAITLRMYLLSGGKPMRMVSQSVDVFKRFNEIRNMVIEPKGSESSREPSVDFLRRLNTRSVKRAPFLVADIETLINADSVHVAYAVGVMKVMPGKELPPKGSISWWFSEDFCLAFVERSKMMLNFFLDYVLTLIRSDAKLQVIYFQNLSRRAAVFLF